MRNPKIAINANKRLTKTSFKFEAAFTSRFFPRRYDPGRRIAFWGVDYPFEHTWPIGIIVPLRHWLLFLIRLYKPLWRTFYQKVRKFPLALPYRIRSLFHTDRPGVQLPSTFSPEAGLTGDLRNPWVNDEIIRHQCRLEPVFPGTGCGASRSIHR